MSISYTSSKTYNLVSNLPGASSNILAHRDDGAGEFDAKGLGRVRRDRVRAFALHYVHSVQAERFYLADSAD